MIEGDRGAAKALNIHPNTLRSRMRRLGLKRPGGSASESWGNRFSEPPTLKIWVVAANRARDDDGLP